MFGNTVAEEFEWMVHVAHGPAIVEMFGKLWQRQVVPQIEALTEN